MLPGTSIDLFSCTFHAYPGALAEPVGEKVRRDPAFRNLFDFNQPVHPDHLGCVDPTCKLVKGDRDARRPALQIMPIQDKRGIVREVMEVVGEGA